MAVPCGGLSTRVMTLVGYCEELDDLHSSLSRIERKSILDLFERPGGVQAAWRAYNFFAIWWREGISRLAGSVKLWTERVLADLSNLNWKPGFEKHAAFSTAFGSFSKNVLNEALTSAQNVFKNSMTILCDQTLNGRAHKVILGAMLLIRLPEQSRQDLCQFDVRTMQQEYARETTLINAFLKPLETFLSHARIAVILAHAEVTKSYLTAARAMWRSFEIQDSALSRAYMESGVTRKLQPRDMVLVFEDTLLRRQHLDIFAVKQRSGHSIKSLTAMIVQTPIIVNRGLSAPPIEEFMQHLCNLATQKTRGQPLKSPLDIVRSLAAGFVQSAPKAIQSESQTLLSALEAATQVAEAQFRFKPSFNFSSLPEPPFDLNADDTETLNHIKQQMLSREVGIRI